MQWVRLEQKVQAFETGIVTDLGNCTREVGLCCTS